MLVDQKRRLRGPVETRLRNRRVDRLEWPEMHSKELGLTLWSHLAATGNFNLNVILCVCYLENHVFLDPEIKRSIAARDVFYLRCTTASLFKFCFTKLKKIFIGAHGQEF
jgi:hypothetical protein